MTDFEEAMLAKLDEIIRLLRPPITTSTGYRCGGCGVWVPNTLHTCSPSFSVFAQATPTIEQAAAG